MFGCWLVISGGITILLQAPVGLRVTGLACLGGVQNHRSIAMLSGGFSIKKHVILIDLSMDWFKGKFTGNHGIYREIWGFPVNFPLNQSIEFSRR